MKIQKKTILLVCGTIYLIASVNLIIWQHIELSEQKDLSEHLAVLKKIEQFKLEKEEFIKKQDQEIRDQKNIILNIRNNILQTVSGSKDEATELIRASMAFVFTNSLHLIDEEHEKYSWNGPVIFKKLYLASQGDHEERPHLSCGPRAFALRDILSQFDIYSRLVQIYSDDFDTPEGHRVLEVYNRDNRRWEVWDPDFGVTYVDRNSRNPVSIMRLVFGSKNDIVPVGLATEGWKATETEHLKDHFFKAVLFEQDGKDPRNITSDIIVNRSIFDLDKKYISGATFEEWAMSVYGNSRIIVLKGQSYN